MALALVTSLFAVPQSPKLQKQGKEKAQTEQQMEQRVPATHQINFAKLQDMVRPEARKAVVKKNVDRKAVRKAPMEEGTTFTFSSITDTLQTINGITVKLAKGGSNSAPAWYESGLRLYASNTITITGESISSANLTFSKQGKKDYAGLTASTGTLVSGGESTEASDKKTDSWTGSATTSVVFTLGASGQRIIYSITVNGQGGGGGGGEEEVAISGLTQAYAIYYEDSEAYYWDFDLAAEFNEESVTYPELYFVCDDEANSKTSIVGTYAAYYAGVWKSAKDSVETDEEEAVGTMTVTYVEEGIYNFEGSFVGTDGNTYTWDATNVEVIAYDADNDYEIIELDEEGGETGDIYSISEAKTAYDGGALKDNDVIAIKGYISGMFLKPTNFATHGSVSIWLTEEEGGTTKEFQLYNCYGLDGDTLTAFSPEATGNKSVDVTTVSSSTCSFSVGDYVEATGKIKKYNSTYELNTGCYLTKIVPAATGVDTVVVDVNAVRAIRFDEYSSAGAYLWQIDAMNYTSSTQYEDVWFNITTPQNNRLEGIYDIESDNIYNFYGYYYYAGYMKVNGSDTTSVSAGSENIQLTVAYDKTSKAYDMFGELLSEDGKTLYQFTVEDMDIVAFNEEEEDIVLVDSVEFVPDTIDIAGLDAIEFAYYASYSAEGSYYNYSANLYGTADGVPYLMLDIYTDVKDEFVGAYDTATNVGEYCGYYPDEESYGESVINPVFTISKEGDVYTISGIFEGADMNYYRFSVSAEATMADGDYPYEPMEKQDDVNVVADSKEVVTDYVSEYGELDIYLNGANDTIQLALVTSKTTIADGTYEISAEEEPASGELIAGYYSSYGLGGCVAYVGDDVFYLVDGSLVVATDNDTTTYTLNATSAHGTVITAFYKEVGAGPTPSEHTIVIADYCSVAADTAFTTTDGVYEVVAHKAKGTQAPAYVATGKDLRIYANGALSISATSQMTEIVFNLSKQGVNRLPELTPSTGNMSYDVADSTATWTGKASDVTFSVGAKSVHASDTTKAGQFAFLSLDIKTSTSLIPASELKEQNAKILMNGQLYIRRKDVLYNAQGQVVK